jgi:hypothetical protein
MFAKIAGGLVRDATGGVIKGTLTSCFHSNTGLTPYSGHTFNIAKVAVVGTSLALLGLGKLMEFQSSLSGELAPTDASDIHEI